MSFLAGIGLVLAAAALGAFLARRFRQPVVVWYILLGLVLGPTGLAVVGDDEALRGLGELGLLLLLFFVGLEFSFARLARVGRVSGLLAFFDVGVNLFTGFLLGKWLGWPAFDAFLLAVIIAISSASIAAKVLGDQRRLGTREGDLLLGVLVVEDLLAILLLVGLVALRGADGSPWAMAERLGVAVLVYAAFLATAALSAKKVTRLLERVHSDELLIPLALGLVFLSAFVAQFLGLPAMTGAFFVGLAFSDSRVAHRLQRKVALFRDTFVAVFFVSFGAQLDVAQAGEAVRVALLAVPLVLVNELLFFGAFAYLASVPGRVAVSMGAGLTARGEEAVMVASVGAKLPGVTQAALLLPVTGILCLVLGSVMPALFRHADRLAVAFAALVPGRVRAGARLVHVAMRAVLRPERGVGAPRRPALRALLDRSSGPRAAVALLRDLLLFGSAAGFAAATRGVAHAALTALAFAALLAALRSLHRALRLATVRVAGDHASPLGRALRTSARSDLGLLPNLVTAAFGGLLAGVFLAASVWAYAWRFAPWVVPLYVLFLGGALAYYALRMRLGARPEPAVSLRARDLGGSGTFVARRAPGLVMMDTGARPR